MEGRKASAAGAGLRSRHRIRANSSVGQSACLTRRMSGVRVPLRPCSELAWAWLADPARQVGVPLVNALEVTTVKVSHRSALSAAGLAAALAVSAIPSVLGAQMRPQGPGPDTKRAVVTTFRGEPDAGVRLANEIRNRIQTDFNIRQLMPVSKKDIDNTLVASGYRPDSALSPNDIKELAKLVRGDEVIDGDGRRDGAGLPRQRAALPAARRRAVAAPHHRREQQPRRRREADRPRVRAGAQADPVRARSARTRCAARRWTSRPPRPARDQRPTRARPSRGSASPTPIRAGRTVPTRRPSRGRTRCSP